jgi:hypothetical protein
MSKKTKTPLQKYLSKPLPPYRRGDADCVAFVAGWVNELSPENPIILLPQTFGDVVRSLRSKPLVEQVAENLNSRGFLIASGHQDGDVVIFEHAASFKGQAVGIYSAGKAVTRMEGEKLFVETDPKIIKAWTLNS